MKIPPRLRGLLLPYALTESGMWVPADRVHLVPPDTRFLCPVCGGEVLHRKPRDKRQHFAHVDRDREHTDEEVSHRIFQMMLYERISGAVSRGKPVPALVGCGTCGGKHRRDIAAGADSVHVERGITPDARPDILLTSAGLPVLAVEVVVTHPVESQAMRAYEALGVPVIELVAETVPPPDPIVVHSQTRYVTRDVWARGRPALLHRSRWISRAPLPCPSQARAADLGIPPLRSADLDWLMRISRTGRVVLPLRQEGEDLRLAINGTRAWWVALKPLLSDLRILRRERTGGQLVYLVDWVDGSNRAELRLSRNRLSAVLLRPGTAGYHAEKRRAAFPPPSETEVSATG